MIVVLNRSKVVVELCDIIFVAEVTECFQKYSVVPLTVPILAYFLISEKD